MLDRKAVSPPAYCRSIQAHYRELLHEFERIQYARQDAGERALKTSKMTMRSATAKIKQADFDA